MFCSEYIGFKSAKQNKQKPAESQAHVHITKTEIRFKYLPVEQTLHENLFNTQAKSHAKESSLQPEFIRSGQVAEPNYASRYNIDNYEV